MALPPIPRRVSWGLLSPPARPHHHRNPRLRRCGAITVCSPQSPKPSCATNGLLGDISHGMISSLRRHAWLGTLLNDFRDSMRQRL